jgi:biotin synthase-related radical SAM superfamily protein
VAEVPTADAVINVSIGTAAVLGLVDVPMAVAPTTAYLMLGGRCLMNCAFCAQARQSQASAINLSRVTWPEFELRRVLNRLPAAVAQGTIRRACLQVTAVAGAFDQALRFVRAVKAVSGVPFDVAILPRGIEQVRQLLHAGADHIGFGLDAASERVYSQMKGGDWAQSLRLIEEAARIFPGRGAVHLMVGLGETEREMAKRIQWVHDRGLTVALFAFTPVRGTRLADWLPPPLATYRRMQAARWLIVRNLDRVEEMSFDDAGQLERFGASVPVEGDAFRTSGCPDCNRPFYNEQPAGPLYNYPRPLTAGETTLAIREMELEGGC